MTFPREAEPLGWLDTQYQPMVSSLGSWSGSCKDDLARGGRAVVLDHPKEAFAIAPLPA
jgi:hypothetical protein